jgi:putative ABC transport system permease protein
VNQMLADDDFASTVGLEIVEGRWFEPGDNAVANRPVVLSRKLKSILFDNGNALGEIIDYCGQQCMVVGICRDFKHKGDYTRSEPTLILRNVNVEDLPYETWMCMYGNYCGQSVFIKTTGNLPEDFEPEMIRQVAGRFQGIVLTLTPLTEIHDKYVRKTWLPLVAIFLVILALFLNVVFGMFGVLWYNISLRRSEIGLRMAVGANRGHIYRQFIAEMVVLTTASVVPGIIIAAQAPLLDLFGIGTPVYIISMFLAALLIFLLVTGSVLMPSYRATRILPANALHEE